MMDFVKVFSLLQNAQEPILEGLEAKLFIIFFSYKLFFIHFM
jgi:hypothetical protein